MTVLTHWNPMPVFYWIKAFERFWRGHVARLKERAERIARQRHARSNGADKKRGKR